MKKILVILIIIASMFLITGCGGSKEEDYFRAVELSKEEKLMLGMVSDAEFFEFYLNKNKKLTFNIYNVHNSKIDAMTIDVESSKGVTKGYLVINFINHSTMEIKALSTSTDYAKHETIIATNDLSKYLTFGGTMSKTRNIRETSNKLEEEYFFFTQTNVVDFTAEEIHFYEDVLTNYDKYGINKLGVVVSAIIK